MLEGLEVNELWLSQVRISNEKLRIDSGYFSKPVLKSELLIRAYANGFDDLGLLFSRFVKGIFEINSDAYVEQGIPFLRILNLRNSTISEGNLAYIPDVLHQSEKKTELLRGDVVLSKTAYPAASLVTLDKCNTSQDTIATTFSDYGKQNYLPEAVVAYLNCAYGARLLWRQFQGNVQLHLGLEDGRKVPIPRMSISLQKTIKKAFDLAIGAQLEANNAYGLAEALLLEALGLANFLPSVEKASVKSFSESFGKTGRLDAEHYQPKYEALYQALAKNNRVFKLGDRLSFNQRGSQPDYADAGLPVVNSKHVQRGEVLMGDTRFANSPDKTNAVVIQPGDVLINGTGVGTIGRAAPYLHTSNALPDNHVTVLRTDALSPICLALYLNSIAGQYQVEQHFKGSSGQIELYPADIANFWCPELDTSIQKQIDALAQQSFTLKSQSKQLLEAAKRAVEIAIEQDEAAGMAYLTQKAGVT